jgi:hypothetical protein
VFWRLQRSLPDPQLTFQMDIQNVVTSLIPGLMMSFPGMGKLRASGAVAAAASQGGYFTFKAASLQSAYDVKQTYYWSNKAEALVQFVPMNWKRMLAYITGSVGEELPARNEYLVTEDRILRSQIQGRIRLTDPERISLASAAKRLGRKGPQEVAQIVRPEKILAWYRRLIAKKFDGSKNWSPGKVGSTSDKIEELILQLASENRSWGYRQIAGALINLGYEVSHQTVANVLERRDLGPAPERGRNISFADTGFLNGCGYLLHDRDAKFCNAFTGILEAVRIKTAKLPARSPNLNANLERWHRSVKEECLSKMILFSEASLRRVLSN